MYVYSEGQWVFLCDTLLVYWYWFDSWLLLFIAIYPGLLVTLLFKPPCGVASPPFLWLACGLLSGLCPAVLFHSGLLLLGDVLPFTVLGDVFFLWRYEIVHDFIWSLLKQFWLLYARIYLQLLFVFQPGPCMILSDVFSWLGRLCDETRRASTASTFSACFLWNSRFMYQCNKVYANYYVCWLTLLIC